VTTDASDVDRWPQDLSDHHRRYLRERGVTPAVAARRGYATLADPRALARGGHGFPRRQAASLAGPVLVIPLFTVAGGRARSQARLPRPVDGRKFVLPRGAPNLLDVHPACYGAPEFRDRRLPLFVTEGVTRGDALWGVGLPAASLTGIWNFRGRDASGQTGPVEDLDLLPVEGRVVVVAPDGDVARNESVRAATRQLAHWLDRRGAAEVRILAPPRELGPKAGLDDLLGRRRAEGRSADEIRAELDDLARPAAEALGAAGPRLRVVTAAEVEPEEVTYLWDPYVPDGKLTIVDGDAGLGKTFLLLALAAAASRGGKLPSGPAGEPAPVARGRTVFFTMEDGHADTIVPRFAALGGRRNQLLLPAVYGDEGEEDAAFTFGDLRALDALLAAERPRLVVFDPFLGYLGARVDAHRSNETRPILARLDRLAARHGCAIVGIRHTRKAREGGAIHAGLGTVDITAAARSVLIVGKHPRREGAVVLAHAKSSTARAGASVEFAIAEGGRLEWGGVSDLRADDLVRAPARRGPEPRATDEVADWLTGVLAGKEGVPAAEVRRLAKARGFTASTVDRAAKRLGVERGRRGSRTSVWRLRC